MKFYFLGFVGFVVGGIVICGGFVVFGVGMSFGGDVVNMWGGGGFIIIGGFVIVSEFSNGFSGMFEMLFDKVLLFGVGVVGMILIF